MLGKTDLDPSGDKVDHNLAILITTTYPIYQLPLESDSKGNRAIYLVGLGEQPIEKTTKEIAREIKELLARAARLEATGKRHNGHQDDSGSSNDEPRDGALSRRHHLKFNS
jgi:hypothetical protein